MEPLPVIEDLDVFSDGEPGFGSGGEGFAVIHLVFQCREEQLGGGIVPAHPGPPDTGPHPVLLAE